ncbi:hypothetical protein PTTG_26988 [Puccinia triticina 1-1 BBBD Race 1]|uniref:Uncharacterized protein n=2 Tax=Puccinia triticina TaxID=208348 RepID=A0A180GPT5_PUCT1|nr:uncharacterized protein PtA15_13A133 [Puccinia triticina]OAV94312.1 hypothetical protein PTTG_26988 [Puccinia triticina 1-1 BBBD Race 1]WAQ90734.1 hypothetical protein PtA15_13A133 [Puccinia triticina]WAR60921.1 hypothetical protein PtB15_13B171 [Puccinia triticina]
MVNLLRFFILQAIGSVAGIPVGRDTSPAATAVLAAEADHGSGALEAHSAEHALDPIPSHHHLPAENQMAVRESPRFPEGDSKGDKEHIVDSDEEGSTSEMDASANGKEHAAEAEGEREERAGLVALGQPGKDAALGARRGVLPRLLRWENLRPMAMTAAKAAGIFYLTKVGAEAAHLAGENWADLRFLTWDEMVQIKDSVALLGTALGAFVVTYPCEFAPEVCRQIAMLICGDSTSHHCYYTTLPRSAWTG